ncbi:MAG: OmpA family protein [Pseudomonadota bacterium]
MPVSWVKFGAGAATFSVAAGLAALSPIGAPAIQTKLQSDALRALTTADLAFASVKADGRTLLLSGSAPDAEQRSAAIRTMAAIPGVTRVDAASLSVAPPAIEPPQEDPLPPPEAEPQPVIETASAEDCQAALNRTLNGRRLTYRLESARLSTEDRALLDDVAEAAKGCSGLTIVIEGHTDAAGSDSANQRLSERRAKEVEAYLLQAALPSTLVVRAYGESRPIATNSSLAGRSANRRIDFVVEAPPSEAPAESE